MATQLTTGGPANYKHSVEELNESQCDVLKGVCGGGGVGWRWYMRWYR